MRSTRKKVRFSDESNSKDYPQTTDLSASFSGMVVDEARNAVGATGATPKQFDSALKKKVNEAKQIEIKKNTAFREYLLSDEKISTGLGSFTHYLTSHSAWTEAEATINQMKKKAKIADSSLQSVPQVHRSNSHSFFYDSSESYSVEPEGKTTSSSQSTWNSPR